MRARQSTSSVLTVSSSESSFGPAGLSTKQWKKVGVELGYPVTADMFENPEDDWLATASSGARARVEVTSSSTQRNDQWISNGVISICQRAGIPKERIMTMRFVHTWKVAEDTGET